MKITDIWVWREDEQIYRGMIEFDVNSVHAFLPGSYKKTAILFWYL